MFEVDRPRFHDLAGIARAITIAGLAGVVTGIVVGGVGGRLFMRIAGAAASDPAQGATTEAGFTVGELTQEGTVSLLLFVGISSGLLGAAWFVIFRPWLSWAGRWRGAAFGLLLFALGSATSDVLNPDNVDFMILGNGPLLVALIAAMFLGFGVSIELLAERLDRRLPASGPGHPIASSLYAVLALLGLAMGGALLFQSLFTTNMCDCEPPLAAAVGTLAAAAGTALWGLSGVRATPAWVARAGGLLGFTGVAIAAAGLARAVGDAVEIVTA